MAPKLQNRLYICTGMKNKLFLVPAPLGDNAPEEVIPSAVPKAIAHVRHFAVEEIRTARRYLSKIGFKGQIDGLSFYEINEHSAYRDLEEMFGVLASGEDMALISEAGLPAVADPGAALVAFAHSRGVQVVPFVGPSSLMLALMASGMNGQCFAFTGYLPVKQEERKKRIRNLEIRSKKNNETQIIIETPYRGDALLADILSVCDAGTRICVAANLTMPDAFVRTASVNEWKASPVEIGKRPAVFLIMA